MREIESIGVTRERDWITLEVTANAFLQHMVRNIAGLLAEIGLGEKTVDWATEVLEGRDRTRGGVAAPPHGLTLVAVGYPRDFEIPGPLAY